MGVRGECGRGAPVTRRSFAQLMAVTGMAGITIQANASDPPVPLENFFQNPAFGQPRMSPDGKSLAVGVAAKNDRTQLVVIDLAAMTAKVVAGFNDGDIWNYHWVNDRRLVYQTMDRQIAPGERYYGPGLFAVDRDGSGFRQLVDRSPHWLREHTTIQRANVDAWSGFAFTSFL